MTIGVCAPLWRAFQNCGLGIADCGLSNGEAPGHSAIRNPQSPILELARKLLKAALMWARSLASFRLALAARAWPVAGRPGWVILALLLAGLPARADEHLAFLKVGNQVYSNVTVTAVTATDISFTYPRGMGNAKR